MNYFLAVSFGISLVALSAFLASGLASALASGLASALAIALASVLPSALASALTGVAVAAGAALVAGVLAKAAAENAPMIKVARSLVMMFPSCCLKTPPIGSDHSTAWETHLLTEIFNYLCQLKTDFGVDVAVQSLNDSVNQSCDINSFAIAFKLS
jgi:hypothetical protein